MFLLFGILLITSCIRLYRKYKEKPIIPIQDRQIISRILFYYPKKVFLTFIDYSLKNWDSFFRLTLLWKLFNLKNKLPALLWQFESCFARYIPQSRYKWLVIFFLCNTKKYNYNKFIIRCFCIYKISLYIFMWSFIYNYITISIYFLLFFKKHN